MPNLEGLLNTQPINLRITSLQGNDDSEDEDKSNYRKKIYETRLSEKFYKDLFENQKAYEYDKDIKLYNDKIKKTQQFERKIPSSRLKKLPHSFKPTLYERMGFGEYFPSKKYFGSMYKPYPKQEYILPKVKETKVPYKKKNDKGVEEDKIEILYSLEGKSMASQKPGIIKRGYRKGKSLIVSGIEGSGSVIKSGVKSSGSLIKSGVKSSGSLIESGIKGSNSVIKSGIKSGGSVLGSLYNTPLKYANEYKQNLEDIKEEDIKEYLPINLPLLDITVDKPHPEEYPKFSKEEKYEASRIEREFSESNLYKKRLELAKTNKKQKKIIEIDEKELNKLRKRSKQYKTLKKERKK